MTFIRPPATVWSEEEMREVPVERPSRSGAGAGLVAGLAAGLRAEVCGRNLLRAADGRRHELTRGALPAVVYAPEGRGHGNFLEASYRRILARPEWSRRLLKAHTAKRQARATGAEEEIRAWRELDTATSSDALLMNVFCYPRVLSGLSGLLGVAAGSVPEFGVRPGTQFKRGLKDTTEADMRIGDLLLEAKLTEGDFQVRAMRLLERYADFEEVFDRDLLAVTGRGVRGYQVARGVLAVVRQGRYGAIVDARRPDMVEEWFSVVRAVRSPELQARLRLYTWQEIAGRVPKRVRVFLAEKYGIEAAAKKAISG